MNEFTIDFSIKPKKRICLNCEAVVTEGDEKSWFCGITFSNSLKMIQVDKKFSLIS